jgi:shikimate kinase/3-dehydroquinate synthase
VTGPAGQRTAPAATDRAPALVFIGFMGAGKTRAAKDVASHLALTPIDTDKVVEQHLGMSIEQCFAEHGEARFREVEEAVVTRLLDQAEGGVIALGGGSVLSERVRTALDRHDVVLLDVDVETAWERASGSGRPLAADRERFAELHASRQEIYLSLADAIVPATATITQELLDALLWLGDAPPGIRLLWAQAASGSYPVAVGRGLLGSSPWPVEGRAFAVTDETVGELYPSALERAVAAIALEPGERAKTIATAERVWRWLAREGAAHGDHVIALGGGVVGDLAGFVAATYQRGIDVVQVPTTLVAQVDSAYGGKTGVDIPEAKNYVGAYHQPAAVVVDPAALDTLPDAERAAGYAEVVKTALIAGGPLWERVASGAPVDEYTILACARTKLAVVAADERDSGRRQVLNLGHTIGHAIETATGYRRFRHGEAVGLGLLAALRLSDQDGLRTQVKGLLARAGLPISMTGVDVDAVVDAVGRDKKRRGGRVGFVLVSEPGDVRTGCPVEPAALEAAVKELDGMDGDDQKRGPS